MQGLDVENKDWMSRRIPSTVNLLLLVSQWKCAHFGRQWKLKVTCGKTQVLKLFLHGRSWKPVSVQKAAIMTWSFANCSRQGLPEKKKREKKTNTFRNETLTFILAEKDGFFPCCPSELISEIFWALTVLRIQLGNFDQSVASGAVVVSVRWTKTVPYYCVSLCKYH